MALRLGEKAKRQRKTVTIDALSAADRKVVHAALQDDPWLTTRSLGQGAYRRLLIIPEGDRKIRDEGPAPAQEREGGRPQRSNRSNCRRLVTAGRQCANSEIKKDRVATTQRTSKSPRTRTTRNRRVERKSPTRDGIGDNGQSAKDTSRVVASG